MRPCTPPGPAQSVWVSSMISSVPVSRGRRAQLLVEARLRQDDADVRQRRLGEDARDVAVGELALQRLGVVPLDDARGLVQRHRRPDVSLARDDRVAVESDERLVDRAVVAPVEDEDLRPAGQLAGEPDGEAVRVGRGQRELPARRGRSGASALCRPRSRPRSGSISVIPWPPARRRRAPSAPASGPSSRRYRRGRSRRIRARPRL